MTVINFFYFFPLQVSVSDLWVKNDSPNNKVFLIVFIAIVVIGVVLINLFRKGSSGSGKGSSKFASGLALRRLIKRIGLTYEQAKMLKFVFKTDEVIDPEKSLMVPALLDQHFKRTYRLIEQSTESDKDIQHKIAVLFSTRNILENTTIGIINTTRQLREETKLNISFNKEKITATVHSAEEEYLSVDSPKNVLGSQIKIAKGTAVNILFFNKYNKGFTFETKVLGYGTLRGHQVMYLAHSNNIKLLSKRRFRRRQTDIACLLFLVYIESDKKKQRMVVAKRRITGNIVDISVGGCSVKTTTPVQVGARFKIEFKQGENKAAALGQVLRTNKTGIKYVIHMKFLRLTMKSMNQINAYVYDYARE